MSLMKLPKDEVDLDNVEKSVILRGNSTPVTTVMFDRQDTGLVTGNLGGTIKVYDSNENKKPWRNLQGHRSGVVSVDYHPFGEFLCSGSNDTMVSLSEDSFG